VELAKQHGIDVPLNRLVYALVRARQAAPDFWAEAQV
jgi:ketopantoate reductase